MVGWRRPAAAATLVKWAWNGSPEGLARGRALTLREAMPRLRLCALPASAASGRDNAWRRVQRLLATQHHGGGVEGEFSSVEIGAVAQHHDAQLVRRKSLDGRAEARGAAEVPHA